MKPVRSHRRFGVALAPEMLWERVTDVGQFQDWWPWLREFDGGPPTEGAVWACTVRPPGPYRVRFAVQLLEVVPGRSILARVTGDVTGVARVVIAADGSGSRLTLSSELEPRSHVLRTIGRLAPALARAGHDWVLTRAAWDFPEPVVALRVGR